MQNDLINKLIERLEELHNYSCFPSDYVSEEQEKVYVYFREKLTEILKLAEEYDQTIDVAELVEKFGQKKVRSNDGWIPCSERLPEETECYLVTWRDRVTCRNYVEIIEYDAGIQEWLDCICQAGLLGYDIIAWQPIPAPYQPKGE